ncbi:T9SS type B sorting domain-containing protein [Chryseobacterium gallinarum]|uniref:T9SS type B sorting domain-containing protein n=1 Tax=Chryseobacterium gallinarum TaxID=1324352 RepID=UPI0020241943|nr:T9SS type B sorting domain-containing protein [Chryseobacterium gallinarum]MCL8536419.1 T9SS type B sorting domain-containing protein [Chryseobacterium gallinarum]
MKKILLLLILSICQVFFAQQDCITSLAVCGSSDISYTPNGPGVQELPDGNCGTFTEQYSVWYKFTIATAGTLTFTITPLQSTSTDYDFYVWGPNVTCNNKGNTIRCNTSYTSGATGLNMTTTFPYAGSGTQNFGAWCKYMDVLPGETYFLLVNNYSANTTGFSLTWGGTATLLSPFTDPVLTPHPFIPPGTPNPNNPNEVSICSNPTIFDFSSLTPGILNGNSNFVVTYHTNQNDALSGNNPITTPQTVGTTTIYYYSIHYQDPTNPTNPVNSCRQTGNFKFKDNSITANDAILTMCNNNNSGIAVFNLTTANVYSGTGTKKYYPTLNDLNTGTNEITNPYTYSSSAGVVYVKITNPQGCSTIAKITLDFYPVVQVKNASISACFTEQNTSTGIFNLNNAHVTTQTNTTKRYFPSLTDALAGTNEIANPTTYIAPNGVVYVRVTDSQNCFSIAEITLVVFPPVKSKVLVDKIICMEDKTTLDAGPGFDGYQWSTGATTQIASNIGVGTYWVKLKTRDCYTTQTVKVYASENPVITGIDISNNTLTINVTGGTPDYQYSMDNIKWQSSNLFTNITRGNHKIYVKDSYNCKPVEISVVVPNLINVITPNEDGINDAIDYSALADKQNLVFTIFDRYGSKIHQADRLNGYKWNGTIAGKKVPTGTYWYTVTWNENDKKNTPFKYSGWIMVKNRE